MKKLAQANVQGFRNAGRLIVLQLYTLVVMSPVLQEKHLVTGNEDLLEPIPSCEDSVRCIYYITGSSLQKLPAVVKDLSVAINESGFIRALLGDKGLTIYIQDVTYQSFKISAAVQYQAYDSIYHVNLNPLNREATSMALATTIIHETMHCVLLSINDRARRHETKALSIVSDFAINRKDPPKEFDYNFFGLMNRGESGHHELMYQLFYPEMISILDRFAVLHHTDRSGPRNSEFLVWSGLQYTDAYEKLGDEKKAEIQKTILLAKGIDAGEN